MYRDMNVLFIYFQSIKLLLNTEKRSFFILLTFFFLKKEKKYIKISKIVYL